ncbi:cell division protein FtsQ [Serratia symbiotica str. 'Cinara cedri']|nr:cell division protein FtsQ [Serratia symbiotica str. 'Cinara cedri']
MSQSALNTLNHRVGSTARPSNGSQLLGIVCLLIVLVIIIWSSLVVIRWMKEASNRPLWQLVVTGECYYTSIDDIRHAILSLGPPGTFMTQDVDVILQQVEQIPWIKQVSVRKEWPDKLKIHLVEYAPVASWNDLYMIDADGISFSEPSEWVRKQSLPLLYGPEGSEKDVLEGYQAMNDILTASKYTLKMVAMSAYHSWRLVLDNDARLELGRDNFMGRLQRFIELYPLLQRHGQEKSKRVSYVDLRYEFGASVGWASLLIDSHMVEAK